MLEEAPDRSTELRQKMRRQGIQRRLELSIEQWTTLSTAVCELLSAHFPQLARCRVGFCWPIKNEPDLRPLMRDWIAQQEGVDGDFGALLPVVVREGAPLAFRRWAPDQPMAPDRYGIPTPTTGAFEPPEALLIPVNAFDAAGYRIGYGGGFFDRSMAALEPKPLCIGVGFELARVDSIRPQAHDIRLDAMVTEAGVFVTPV